MGYEEDPAHFSAFAVKAGAYLRLMSQLHNSTNNYNLGAIRG